MPEIMQVKYEVMPYGGQKVRVLERIAGGFVKVSLELNPKDGDGETRLYQLHELRPLKERN